MSTIVRIRYSFSSVMSMMITLLRTEEKNFLVQLENLSGLNIILAKDYFKDVFYYF